MTGGGRQATDCVGARPGCQACTCLQTPAHAEGASVRRVRGGRHGNCRRVESEDGRQGTAGDTCWRIYRPCSSASASPRSIETRRHAWAVLEPTVDLRDPSPVRGLSPWLGDKARRGCYKILWYPLFRCVEGSMVARPRSFLPLWLWLLLLLLFWWWCGRRR